jgi:hypothetical protein
MILTPETLADLKRHTELERTPAQLGGCPVHIVFGRLDRTSQPYKGQLQETLANCGATIVDIPDQGSVLPSGHIIKQLRSVLPKLPAAS